MGCIAQFGSFLQQAHSYSVRYQLASLQCQTTSFYQACCLGSLMAPSLVWHL